MSDKPECWMTYTEDKPECEECEHWKLGKAHMVRLNPKLKNRTERKPSRPRAIKAKCWDCMGGLTGDCEIPSCPLYAFRKQNEGEPKLWWMEPTNTWKEGYLIAMSRKPPKDPE